MSAKMGDTAPPQAPTGGLGGAPGAGLLGGGSVTPRVHSAIVERLRARIAVCRQHHLSCEGRYERGRAESSDRERESTLQLLSLVQHGQGARKTGKHAKAPAPAATTTAPPPPAAAPATASQAAAAAAPPPPPDYHHHHQQHLLNSSSSAGGGGLDGDPQAPAPAAADPRNPALIAVRLLLFSPSGRGRVAFRDGGARLGRVRSAPPRAGPRCHLTSRGHWPRRLRGSCSPARRSAGARARSSCAGRAAGGVTGTSFSQAPETRSLWERWLRGGGG